MTYFPSLQTVAQTISFHSQNRPAHLALIYEDETITYGDLDRVSNATAHGLKAAGLKPGARVAYLGKESITYYEVLFACAKCDCVLVPINWRLAAEEVRHILSDSTTEAIFLDSEYEPIVIDLKDSLPALKTIIVVDTNGGNTGFSDWRENYPNTPHSPFSGSDDPVAQLYTSGTTGLPKGVILANRSFFAIRTALADNNLNWIDWQPDDISLIGIPGFHVGGLWWAMQGFNAGITNVAMKMFVAYDAVDQIEKCSVTVTCVVPAMIQMMLSERSVSADRFKTLRKIIYGGSPISETLLENAIDVMQCDFAQIYGLTETGNTAVCLPPRSHVPGKAWMNAAGLPYPGVQLKVIDGHGEQLSCGEVGEICIKTPAHMLGYWKNEKATESTLIEGWIYTGDAGYLDDEGYLFICDRIKDVIIVAGENIYPAEIENVLSKHPAVYDTAVIGVPDERWGETITAFVALKPGDQVSARDLLLFLKNRIASYKVPSKYEFVKSIPRNPSGKILRRKLRDRFWSHMARQVN
jgi:acyl-CoA synthetase (AMP-forming)/AMP-acid ligase II